MHFKDVRAICLCAFLLRTPQFARYAERAASDKTGWVDYAMVNFFRTFHTLYLWNGVVTDIHSSVHFWRKTPYLTALHVRINPMLGGNFRANVLKTYCSTECSKEESTPHQISNQVLCFPVECIQEYECIHRRTRGAGLRKLDSVLKWTTHEANVLYSCFWCEEAFYCNPAR